MRFAHLQAFWLCGIFPILGVLFWMGRQKKEAFLHSLSDLSLYQQTPARFPWLQKPWISSLLLLGTFLGVILALADPRLPAGTARLRTGALDVLLLVDVSKSMAAEDYGPLSRLEKAGEIARDLLTELQGNRVGIVTFAGTSFRQAELTEDVEALRFIVTHWLSIDSVGLGGSNLTKAIETGVAMFPEDSSREKLLILLSDGGEQENLTEVLAKTTRRGIRVMALGLGSLHPSKIPQYDAQKKFTGYLKINEQIVTTRLNEDTLRQIAQATQGIYHRIEGNGSWNRLLTTSTLAEHLVTREEYPLFQPFLLLSLLAFCAQTLIRRL